MDDRNESSNFPLLHHSGFRLFCFVIGALMVTLGSCGALNKVSHEGWEGPSSQPGAAHQRSR